MTLKSAFVLFLLPVCIGVGAFFFLPNKPLENLSQVFALSNQETYSFLQEFKIECDELYRQANAYKEAFPHDAQKVEKVIKIYELQEKTLELLLSIKELTEGQNPTTYYNYGEKITKIVQEKTGQKDFGTWLNDYALQLAKYDPAFKNVQIVLPAEQNTMLAMPSFESLRKMSFEEREFDQILPGNLINTIHIFASDVIHAAHICMTRLAQSVK